MIRLIFLIFIFTYAMYVPLIVKLIQLEALIREMNERQIKLINKILEWKHE